MTTPLQNAANVLLGTLKMSGGVTITYRRGASETELKAVPGDTQYEIVGPDGITEVVQSRDWLIATEELNLHGIPTLPKLGDEISESGRIYRILDLEGIGPYSYSDQYRQIIRAHSKQIDVPGYAMIIDDLGNRTIDDNTNQIRSDIMLGS